MMLHTRPLAASGSSVDGARTTRQPGWMTARGPVSNEVAFRWGGVCLDCADAEEMARFYGELFGWSITARDERSNRQGGSGWIAMSGPSGGPGVSFQAESWYEPPTWPERPGAPAKMMHFEVGVDDLEAAVARVIAAGGRLAPEQPEGRSDIRVVLDPAGHPFCLCP